MIICGTGHRPQDLPCGFAHKDSWKLDKLAAIKRFLMANEVSRVISGMALGYDQWLAYASLSLNINLSAYIPFQGQEIRWNEKYQKQYASLLARCNTIQYVCEGSYAPWKMQRRNEVMIQDSDLVLALWNPAKKTGGTFNAVSYALKINKPIFNIWNDIPEQIYKRRKPHVDTEGKIK